MALFQLKVAGGAVISAIEIRYTETYASLLEGGRTGRTNHMIIEMAKGRADAIWPRVPIVVIAPRLSSSDQGRESLPRIQCMIWWRSFTTVRSVDKTGSHLVTIHFQNEVSIPLPAEIEAEMNALDWRSSADDFEL